tara:strand:- start:233 stop:469 length:237 start_codon:yes stop_codon:yes gene_type:complete
MSVDKAHEFLKELKANGPSPDLMKRIGTDFQSEHMHEALKAKGTSKDELLKAASGGSSTNDWCTGNDLLMNTAASAGA